VWLGLRANELRVYGLELDFTFLSSLLDSDDCVQFS
jgi:hypothetical protein